MAFKEKENQVAHGSLGKAKEQLSDKHPSMKGSLTFSRDVKAGEKIWLSAWTKIGDEDDKWLSIAAERSSKPGTAPAPKPAASKPYDDEIPF